MAREIPEFVRAAAGLAATVLDEARKLPQTLPGLPIRLIGLAMQHAMKVQQQYAGLVARGDELFTGLRGDDEPGLATFDDEEPLPQPTGFRDSAFDRAGDAAPTADLITDEDVVAGEAPDTDAILDEIAIDELVDQAPTLEETAPATPEKANGTPTKKAAKSRKAAKATPDSTADSTDSTADSTAALDAEPTADVATTVDVLTPDGEVASVEATVTDEGVAAAETPQDAEPAPTADAPVTQNDATAADAATADAATATADAVTDDGTAASATATATDESGTPVATATGAGTDAPTVTPTGDTAITEGAAVDADGEASTTAPTDNSQRGSDLAGSQAAGAAPVDGYDTFSVAQLRGRLRGYTLGTVEELIAYEQATRARAPYLTMLRNRLEKLEERAIESSPLAPRGI